MLTPKSQLPANGILNNKLDVQEAAAYLGIAGNTLRVWAQKGKLRHTKVGWRYFFDVADLDAMLTVTEPTLPQNDEII